MNAAARRFFFAVTILVLIWSKICACHDARLHLTELYATAVRR